MSTATAASLAALDARLSVTRALPIETIRPLDPSARDAGTADREPYTARALSAVMARSSPTADAFAARWPVGSEVIARVLAATDERVVTADVDGIALEIRWRADEGLPPRVGDALAFRVMAHAPQLVLQRTAWREAPTRLLADHDAPTRLSDDALFLQTLVDPLADGPDTLDHAVRFTHPLIDESSLHDADTVLRDDPDPTASQASGLRHDAHASALAFAPVVLSGPAWPGQPMELMLRRHARDDALDDPALDAWCGEITLDLPRLGRVAGHLSYSMQGVRLRIEADEADGAVELDAALPELAAALVDAGLRLSSLSVGAPTHLAAASTSLVR